MKTPENLKNVQNRRYDHLPPAARRELRRLKREEAFLDLPANPGPGALALMKTWEAPDGRPVIEGVTVSSDGTVFRFAEIITPLKPHPPASSTTRRRRR